MTLWRNRTAFPSLYFGRQIFGKIIRFGFQRQSEFSRTYPFWKSGGLADVLKQGPLQHLEPLDQPDAQCCQSSHLGGSAGPA
jgi:hypothetical protein